MHNLYILDCDNVYYYIGIAKDVKKRLAQHINGESRITKRFSSIRIVYIEKFDSKEEAAKREKQIKGWSKTKKESLVKGNISQLKKLSKRRI